MPLLPMFLIQMLFLVILRITVEQMERDLFIGR